MEEPTRRGIMLDRAMIIVKKTIKMVEDIWVIGWPIRTVRWAWEGVGYLWDERKDRQRYGKPIRAWMVWKKLGREMTVAIQEGAEREKTKKAGRKWGWIRGIQWVDRGVRGPEDRREMWLHSGDNVIVREGKIEDQQFWAAVDFGKEHPEVMFMEVGVNKPADEEMAEVNERRVNQGYVREFMEGYGRRRQVMPVVSRGMGKTAAAKMTKKIMEEHGIKVKEMGKTYGKRLG